jgi:GDPmannose 4,6-dehydratase
MWRMLQHHRADDYVIATGETRSLEDFVAAAFRAVGLEWREHVVADPSLFRPTDIAANGASPEKAHRVLGWRAEAKMDEAVRRMAEAERALQEGRERPASTSSNAAR